ncbi:RHS repeat-associated core domain-containing protein, partial [Aeromonas salmonicida]|uniref:RHS repeat-associated core domain-containing protein n=1 Tax=Aeromonas salmonicida TaxID=645 RepID=UPI0023EED2E1
YDQETGLYYNRYRYFDPELGQYISSDPIGFAGGLRPQGYVHNPLEWVDPFGLNTELIRYKPRDELTAITGRRQGAINKAWALEKNLIKETGAGTRSWSAAELELIKNTPNSKLTSVMSQAGYTGHHINSVEGNGLLGEKWAGDPRNIMFLQNNKHPSGVNEHVHSLQGHRGNTRNSTQGRLIDRQAMIDSHARSKKC